MAAVPSFPPCREAGLVLVSSWKRHLLKSRFIPLLIVTLSSFLLCTLELGSPESSKVAAL